MFKKIMAVLVLAFVPNASFAEMVKYLSGDAAYKILNEGKIIHTKAQSSWNGTQHFVLKDDYFWVCSVTQDFTPKLTPLNDYILECSAYNPKEGKEPEVDLETFYYEFPGILISELKYSRRFLQVMLGIKTKPDAIILDNIKSHVPELKSTIEALLAEYTEEAVVGREARKALAINIQFVMNERLQELTGMGGIEEVLFTSYLMQ